MTRHPADSYVGLRWQPRGASREGVSCWGLVALYHREQLGRALANYDIAPGEIGLIRDQIAAAIASGDWTLAEHPADGDVVTMSRRDAPHHLGVYAAGHVLHVTASLGAVVAQSVHQLANDRWGRIRFWRHR